MRDAPRYSSFRKGRGWEVYPRGQKCLPSDWGLVQHTLIFVSRPATPQVDWSDICPSLWSRKCFCEFTMIDSFDIWHNICVVNFDTEILLLGIVGIYFFRITIEISIRTCFRLWNLSITFHWLVIDSSFANIISVRCFKTQLISKKCQLIWKKIIY